MTSVATCYSVSAPLTRFTVPQWRAAVCGRQVHHPIPNLRQCQRLFGRRRWDQLQSAQHVTQPQHFTLALLSCVHTRTRQPSRIANQLLCYVFFKNLRAMTGCLKIIMLTFLSLKNVYTPMTQILWKQMKNILIMRKGLARNFVCNILR